MQLITNNQARLMASSVFHSPRRNGRKSPLTSQKTNREGAWFLKGTMQSGFIIDARCLTDDERNVLAEWSAPVIATEFRDPDTGEIMAFLNPVRQTSRTIYTRMKYRRNDVEIFILAGYKNWCLAQIFCGITAEGGPDKNPKATFMRHHAPSNHAYLKATGMVRMTQRGTLHQLAA
jgi:hypothetical protein